MSTDVEWEEIAMPYSKNDGQKNEAQNPSNQCWDVTKIPKKYLDKYREFIRNNRFVLSLAEDGLSRLVLYAPNRFISQSEEDFVKNSSKILPETLYALINLWSLFNDAIYHGLGRGNGLTVGIIEEGTSVDSNDAKLGKRSQAILLLRSILSIVECMAPSLEVSAYSRNNRRTGSNAMPRKNSIDLGHHRHLNALSMSSKIEKIKFLCRMGIMALNYSEQIKFSTKKKDNARNVLSRLGIIQEGGLLEPDEHPTASNDEHKRVEKLLYVGKRTGRQIRYNANQVHSSTMSLSTITSLGGKIGMTIIGDLLHVFRPLYYVLSSLNHETIGGNKGRQGMIKSWVLSLAMDLLSQRLIIAGKTVQKGKNGCAIDVSSEATKHEMYHRKMRLTLYLLRSPVWSMATYPLAEKLSRIIQVVPIVGKPLVQYMMDILNYWQKWHFMLEG